MVWVHATFENGTPSTGATGGSPTRRGLKICNTEQHVGPDAPVRAGPPGPAFPGLRAGRPGGGRPTKSSRAAQVRKAGSTRSYSTGQTYVIDFKLRSFPAADHVLCEEDLLKMIHIPLLASVALLVDLPDHSLTRGQMGTVVEYLGSGDEQAVL